MSREEIVERIEQKKQEMKTAGKIHRRDLRKHIHRMEIELLKYDRYRKGAA